MTATNGHVSGDVNAVSFVNSLLDASGTFGKTCRFFDSDGELKFGQVRDASWTPGNPMEIHVLTKTKKRMSFSLNSNSQFLAPSNNVKLLSPSGILQCSSGASSSIKEYDLVDFVSDRLVKHKTSFVDVFHVPIYIHLGQNKHWPGWLVRSSVDFSSVIGHDIVRVVAVMYNGRDVDMFAPSNAISLWKLPPPTIRNLVHQQTHFTTANIVKNEEIYPVGDIVTSSSPVVPVDPLTANEELNNSKNVDVEMKSIDSDSNPVFSSDEEKQFCKSFEAVSAAYNLSADYSRRYSHYLNSVLFSCFGSSTRNVQNTSDAVSSKLSSILELSHSIRQYFGNQLDSTQLLDSFLKAGVVDGHGRQITRVSNQLGINDRVRSVDSNLTGDGISISPENTVSILLSKIEKFMFCGTQFGQIDTADQNSLSMLTSRISSELMEQPGLAVGKWFAWPSFAESPLLSGLRTESTRTELTGIFSRTIIPSIRDILLPSISVKSSKGKNNLGDDTISEFLGLKESPLNVLDVKKFEENLAQIERCFSMSTQAICWVARYDPNLDSHLVIVEDPLFISDSRFEGRDAMSFSNSSFINSSISSSVMKKRCIPIWIKNILKTNAIVIPFPSPLNCRNASSFSLTEFANLVFPITDSSVDKSTNDPLCAWCNSVASPSNPLIPCENGIFRSRTDYYKNNTYRARSLQKYYGGLIRSFKNGINDMHDPIKLDTFPFFEKENIDSLIEAIPSCGRLAHVGCLSPSEIVYKQPSQQSNKCLHVEFGSCAKCHSLVEQRGDGTISNEITSVSPEWMHGLENKSHSHVRAISIAGVSATVPSGGYCRTSSLTLGSDILSYSTYHSDPNKYSSLGYVPAWSCECCMGCDGCGSSSCFGKEYEASSIASLELQIHQFSKHLSRHITTTLKKMQKHLIPMNSRTIWQQISAGWSISKSQNTRKFAALLSLYQLHLLHPNLPQSPLVNSRRFSLFSARLTERIGRLIDCVSDMDSARGESVEVAAPGGISVGVSMDRFSEICTASKALALPPLSYEVSHNASIPSVEVAEKDNRHLKKKHSMPIPLPLPLPLPQSQPLSVSPAVLQTKTPSHSNSLHSNAPDEHKSHGGTNGTVSFSQPTLITSLHSLNHWTVQTILPLSGDATFSVRHALAFAAHATPVTHAGAPKKIIPKLLMPVLAPWQHGSVEELLRRQTHQANLVAYLCYVRQRLEPWRNDASGKCSSESSVLNVYPPLSSVSMLHPLIISSKSKGQFSGSFTPDEMEKLTKKLPLPSDSHYVLSNDIFKLERGEFDQTLAHLIQSVLEQANEEVDDAGKETFDSNSNEPSDDSSHLSDVKMDVYMSFPEISDIEVSNPLNKNHPAVVRKQEKDTSRVILSEKSNDQEAITRNVGLELMSNSPDLLDMLVVHGADNFSTFSSLFEFSESCEYDYDGPLRVSFSRTGESEPSPAAPLRVRLCGPCSVRSSRTSRTFCPLCRGGFDSYSSGMVACDSCRGWAHAHCDFMGLADLALVESGAHPFWSKTYLCSSCRFARMLNLHSRAVLEDKFGFFFLPVDPANAPGYSNVITRPMDLLSIKHALQRGVYNRCGAGAAGVLKFRDDLEQIVYNALVFNTPQDKVYKEALRILRVVDVLFEKTFPYFPSKNHSTFEALLSNTPSTGAPSSNNSMSPARNAGSGTGVAPIATLTPQEAFAADVIARFDDSYANDMPRRQLSASKSGTDEARGTALLDIEPPVSTGRRRDAVTSNSIDTRMKHSAVGTSHVVEGKDLELRVAKRNAQLFGQAASAQSAKTRDAAAKLAPTVPLEFLPLPLSTAPGSLPTASNPSGTLFPLPNAAYPSAELYDSLECAVGMCGVDICSVCGRSDSDYLFLFCSDCGECRHVHCASSPLFLELLKKAQHRVDRFLQNSSGQVACCTSTDSTSKNCECEYCGVQEYLHLLGNHQAVTELYRDLETLCNSPSNNSSNLNGGSQSPLGAPFALPPLLQALLHTAPFRLELERLRRTGGWRCGNCTVCSVCGEGGSEFESLLLVCDSCESAVHTFCCSPAIVDIPQSDTPWYCGACVHCTVCSTSCEGKEVSDPACVNDDRKYCPSSEKLNHNPCCENGEEITQWKGRCLIGPPGGSSHSKLRGHRLCSHNNTALSSAHTVGFSGASNTINNTPNNPNINNSSVTAGMVYSQLGNWSVVKNRCIECLVRLSVFQGRGGESVLVHEPLQWVGYPLSQQYSHQILSRSYGSSKSMNSNSAPNSSEPSLYSHVVGSLLGHPNLKPTSNALQTFSAIGDKNFESWKRSRNNRLLLLPTCSLTSEFTDLGELVGGMPVPVPVLPPDFGYRKVKPDSNDSSDSPSFEKEKEKEKEKDKKKRINALQPLSVAGIAAKPIKNSITKNSSSSTLTSSVQQSSEPQYEEIPDETCPLCSLPWSAFGSHAADTMIGCNSCDRWVHSCCDPLFEIPGYRSLLVGESVDGVVPYSAASSKEKGKQRQLWPFISATFTYPPATEANDQSYVCPGCRTVGVSHSPMEATVDVWLASKLYPYLKSRGPTPVSAGLPLNLAAASVTGLPSVLVSNFGGEVAILKLLVPALLVEPVSARLEVPVPDAVVLTELIDVIMPPLQELFASSSDIIKAGLPNLHIILSSNSPLSIALTSNRESSNMTDSSKKMSTPPVGIVGLPLLRLLIVNALLRAALRRAFMEADGAAPIPALQALSKRLAYKMRGLLCNSTSFNTLSAEDSLFGKEYFEGVGCLTGIEAEARVFTQAFLVAQAILLGSDCVSAGISLCFPAPPAPTNMTVPSNAQHIKKGVKHPSNPQEPSASISVEKEDLEHVVASAAAEYLRYQGFRPLGVLMIRDFLRLASTVAVLLAPLRPDTTGYGAGDLLRAQSLQSNLKLILTRGGNDASMNTFVEDFVHRIMSIGLVSGATRLARADYLRSRGNFGPLSQKQALEIAEALGNFNSSDLASVFDMCVHSDRSTVQDMGHDRTSRAVISPARKVKDTDVSKNVEMEDVSAEESVRKVGGKKGVKRILSAVSSGSPHKKALLASERIILERGDDVDRKIETNESKDITMDTKSETISITAADSRASLARLVPPSAGLDSLLRVRTSEVHRQHNRRCLLCQQGDGSFEDYQIHDKSVLQALGPLVPVPLPIARSFIVPVGMSNADAVALLSHFYSDSSSSPLSHLWVHSHCLLLGKYTPASGPSGGMVSGVTPVAGGSEGNSSPSVMEGDSITTRTQGPLLSPTLSDSGEITGSLHLIQQALGRRCGLCGQWGASAACSRRVEFSTLGTCCASACSMNPFVHLPCALSHGFRLSLLPLEPPVLAPDISLDAVRRAILPAAVRYVQLNSTTNEKRANPMHQSQLFHLFCHNGPTNPPGLSNSVLDAGTKFTLGILNAVFPREQTLRLHMSGLQNFQSDLINNPSAFYVNSAISTSSSASQTPSSSSSLAVELSASAESSESVASAHLPARSSESTTGSSALFAGVLPPLASAVALAAPLASSTNYENLNMSLLPQLASFPSVESLFDLTKISEYELAKNSSTGTGASTAGSSNAGKNATMKLPSFYRPSMKALHSIHPNFTDPFANPVSSEGRALGAVAGPGKVLGKLRSGALTVVSFGSIVTKSPRFHNQTFIFPANYSARRIWWGPVSLPPRMGEDAGVEHNSRPMYRLGRVLYALDIIESPYSVAEAAAAKNPTLLAPLFCIRLIPEESDASSVLADHLSITSHSIHAAFLELRKRIVGLVGLSAAHLLSREEWSLELLPFSLEDLMRADSKEVDSSSPKSSSLSVERVSSSMRHLRKYFGRTTTQPSSLRTSGAPSLQGVHRSYIHWTSGAPAPAGGGVTSVSTGHLYSGFSAELFFGVAAAPVHKILERAPEVIQLHIPPPPSISAGISWSRYSYRFAAPPAPALAAMIVQLRSLSESQERSFEIQKLLQLAHSDSLGRINAVARLTDLSVHAEFNKHLSFALAHSNKNGAQDAPQTMLNVVSHSNTQMNNKSSSALASNKPRLVKNVISQLRGLSKQKARLEASSSQLFSNRWTVVGSELVLSLDHLDDSKDDLNRSISTNLSADVEGDDFDMLDQNTQETVSAATLHSDACNTSSLSTEVFVPNMTESQKSTLVKSKSKLDSSSSKLLGREESIAMDVCVTAPAPAPAPMPGRPGRKKGSTIGNNNNPFAGHSGAVLLLQPSHLCLSSKLLPYDRSDRSAALHHSSSLLAALRNPCIEAQSPEVAATDRQSMGVLPLERLELLGRHPRTYYKSEPEGVVRSEEALRVHELDQVPQVVPLISDTTLELDAFRPRVRGRYIAPSSSHLNPCNLSDLGLHESTSARLSRALLYRQLESLILAGGGLAALPASDALAHVRWTLSSPALAGPGAIETAIKERQKPKFAVLKKDLLPLCMDSTQAVVSRNDVSSISKTSLNMIQSWIKALPPSYTIYAGKQSLAPLVGASSLPSKLSISSISAASDCALRYYLVHLAAICSLLGFPSFGLAHALGVLHTSALSQPNVLPAFCNEYPFVSPPAQGSLAPGSPFHPQLSENLTGVSLQVARLLQASSSNISTGSALSSAPLPPSYALIARGLLAAHSYLGSLPFPLPRFSAPIFPISHPNNLFNMGGSGTGTAVSGSVGTSSSKDGRRGSVSGGLTLQGGSSSTSSPFTSPSTPGSGTGSGSAASGLGLLSSVLQQLGISSAGPAASSTHSTGGNSEATQPVDPVTLSNYHLMKSRLICSVLTVRRSPIHGWGLFVRKRMPKDSVLIEYTGETVREPVADLWETTYEELARMSGRFSHMSGSGDNNNVLSYNCAVTAKNILRTDYHDSMDLMKEKSADVSVQSKLKNPPNIISEHSSAVATRNNTSNGLSMRTPYLSDANTLGNTHDAVAFFRVPLTSARRSDGSGSCYLFRLDELHIVDATVRGSAARFVNHSCEPNCYSRTLLVDGHKVIVICALRDLEAGEELTYNYKFAIESDPKLKIACYCGAPSCWGTMN